MHKNIKLAMQCNICPGIASIPATVNVFELAGTVSVCAALAITPATATTPRDITVSLATSDGTG